MQFSLNEIADKLAEVAREAGNLIMALYDSGAFATTEKADDSPVTTADIKASEFIINELQNAFPDIPVLSEESSHEALSTRAQWSSYFLIDPIDGTQEFIARSGDFAVNIAYVEQRQPAIGVIYWPPGETLYSAIREQGAFKYALGEKTPISVRKLEDPRHDPLILAISRRQPRQKVMARIQTERDIHPLPTGSCSLKACFIAEGKADCFLRLGPTGEWDTAASQVIVTEAGGSLLNENFEPITYNETESLLNPNFFVLGDPQVDWQQVFVAHPPNFR
ncbi:3'(2'),5'-bisphosphate nucleotidase [Idiomarina fontislapidosi]|uniref:3'(2'),5'-bisphosphate nucleotidase CysQ n=1 Tax=Idiomarina fontislapidosi TaxID=263723 RepID=A0A432XUB7_9GAMM|nr:3'(2'),5'-bisphosphate nucleotidase CysQ [Idiomarina fontislapidosi]PYE31582.1 3'(2'),5'-bisphosphate nucleotidase [Idiomarina fontislapidosi]RUO52214.1 3'(2'),5'-bisphosphate nucleotidase [Idiomarina fontislapidosi]